MNNDILIDFGSTDKPIPLEIEKSSASSSYPPLANKPKINGVTLLGDLSFDDLGLPPTEWGEIEGEITDQHDLMDKLRDQKADALAVWEIEKILYMGE